MLDDRLTTILALGSLTVDLALRHTIMITLSGLLICLGDVPQAWMSQPKTLFPHLILSCLSVSLPSACDQLSRKRTIKLMFLLLALMSDAMELCVGATIVAANHKGKNGVLIHLSFALFVGHVVDYQKRCVKRQGHCTDSRIEQMLIR